MKIGEWFDLWLMWENFDVLCEFVGFLKIDEFIFFWYYFLKSVWDYFYFNIIDVFGDIEFG